MAKQLQERQKIVIGVNSLVSTVHAAYSNHMQLFYRLGRSYPNIDFCFVNPPRMSIDRMRNLAAETALDIEASHLLFIDDDVLIPQPFDFLDKLLKLKVPIAAGNVLIRGYPFNYMFFHYTDNRQGLVQFKKLPKGHKPGPLAVDAVGFSCCLIETDLLRKLPKPYFITGVSNTEDVYFCYNARLKYPDLPIVVDTSIECGHILWNEVIEPSNKKAYTEYFEKLNGKPMEDEKDRGESYYKLVKAVTKNETTEKTA